jgi:hypothetical protein
MPTVVVRFEPNKKNPERGTIYYRIYKGHNRRMEFSSRLHLSASSWDETARTIRDDYPESGRLINSIILLCNCLKSCGFETIPK